MVKDDRTILRAHVRALAVRGRGIMVRPKNIKQLLVANECWIELDLHHFGMAGLVRAHVFVSRILCRTTGVSDRGVRDAARGAKGGFHAPETTRAECRFFCRHGFTMKRERRRCKWRWRGARHSAPRSGGFQTAVVFLAELETAALWKRATSPCRRRRRAPGR